MISELECEAARICPVFVIGGNRSGTSLLAYLLSQNPSLFGLFSTGAEEQKVVDGHLTGFCESNFLWSGLNQKGMRHSSSPAVFALPENISSFYRNCSQSFWERRRLRKAVLQYCKADKKSGYPLIKDNLNVLRVGLIKQLFPKAKFVMIVRSSDSYIVSNKDKWDHALPQDWRKPPVIGLHWQLLNTTAIYDLVRFASKDHIIVDFDEITGGNDTKRVIDGVFDFLGVPQIKLDLSIIQASKRFSSDLGGEGRHLFDLLAAMVDREQRC